MGIEKYDIMRMVAMQKAIDTDIRKYVGMENEVLYDNNIIAFKVELGEFLNKTDTHKYWRKGITIYSRTEQLEEFADCIAFLLSIGLEKGWYRFAHAIGLNIRKENINELMLDLFNNNLDSSGKWVDALQDLFQLGLACGFTLSEIEKGFGRKVHINLDRIKGGY